MKKLLIFSAFLLFLFSCDKKPVYEFPFQDPELRMDERISDLLTRMTLEEKITQLNYDSKAIERLGVPQYNWWNECLHGVARSGLATVFPQAIGLAASWDRDMMNRVATTISDEGRAKYHDYVRKEERGIYQGITFWTPNINIFRDPRWGRGMETYGEDPFLTGEMAVSFINGIQGDDPKYYKAIATSKHYAVHNGPEPLRHTFDAVVSDHDLRNTYLPAFEKTIKEAKVASVMCAYNRFNGEPCCGSSELLQSILRDEWKFDGYVVSDCWALVDFYEEGHHEVVKTSAEAAALAFRTGTDVNCGSVSPSLLEAVEKGYISEDIIDRAVSRLLKARFEMGMFDPDEMVPYASIPIETLDSDANKEMALEATKKSMVLLKNENNALPLSKDLKKVAVIGPNANDVPVLLGNYNGFPSAPVTPLQGIRAKLPGAEVMYAMGCSHAESLPAYESVPGNLLYSSEDLSSNGVNIEFFDSLNFNAEPLYTGIDPEPELDWISHPAKEVVGTDRFIGRWITYLKPGVSGKYTIGGDGLFSIDVSKDGVSLTPRDTTRRRPERFRDVELVKGETYKVEARFFSFRGNPYVNLVWTVPGRNLEAEALEIAGKSDVVIMFMGLSPRLEGEEMRVEVPGFNGGDRIRIDLPDYQQNLIKKIHATGKPTVLVLLNGSALALNWENENIPAILEAWYPGQAAGTAIADILFGDYNPAGRLPLTFYHSVKEIPEFENYNMDGFTYRYFKGKPLYPFGYGLSYTTFEYSDVKLDSEVLEGDQAVIVSVNVKNTGKLAGEEVVQLYIRDVDARDPRPVKDLRGFERIRLEPGESRTLEFELTPRALAYWNIEKHDYVPTKGLYEVMVGSSSADKDLTKLELVVK